MSEVELVHVSRAYGRTLAVDDVSLTVREGEFAALVGPSGCGKTTLLRMIAGFLEPTAGEIRLQGRNVVSVPVHRRNTAMVFQSYALFPHLTVGRNVAFGLEMRGVPRAEAAERVQRALALVRLSGLEHRYPRQLSGGQQQRVALARALVTQPLVLLLDEPLSNLDARLRQEMREEIRELQRQLRITTVFVTHDQEEALSLADRVVVMNAGRVEQVGSPAEVYVRPATRFVGQFIGDANFLEGTVESIDGSCVRVMHPSGVVLAGRGTDLSVGEPSAVVVRPDVVRVVDGHHPAGANVVTATVEDATYLGSRVLLRAASSVGRLRAIGEPRALGALERGASVRLGWQVEDVVVLRA